MNWFKLICAIGELLWMISVLVWLLSLRHEQRAFQERCQRLKELQDKTDAAIQKFLTQVNKDIDSLQDRAAELEKEKETDNEQEG